jgi:deoxyribodipyrimidine photolyase-like uncharacterized protein
MKVAMLRYAEGGVSVRLPFRVMVHMVAVLYGQSPESVRAWPADDFMDAMNFRMVTSGK